MRLLSLLAIAALFLTGAAFGAADPLAGLRFADGANHSYADFSKQTLIVVQFCAH